MSAPFLPRTRFSQIGYKITSKLNFCPYKLLAFRRHRNLCDVLEHRKTDKILGRKEEQCACDFCKSIIKDTIPDTKGEKHYNVIKDAICKDRNLIYSLFCNRCAKTVYVGETERILKERTTEHKRDIKFQKDKPIMRHFRGHEEKDLSVAILTRTAGESKIYRLCQGSGCLSNGKYYTHSVGFTCAPTVSPENL